MEKLDRSTHGALARVAERTLPRILTQVCRDEGSPFFGCFDRNWWHYKIRDFPSVILQQGGYTLGLAARLPQWKADAAALDKVAAGACRFWNARARQHGAFEEYYPWEQGYPPLAFSTLAIVKLALEKIVGKDEIHEGCTVAARQLTSRFESQAGNQQVAGLAALAAIRKLFPDLVSADAFEGLTVRTLALQHAEGWFVEYDGPDLGYLTVTMDCLWDLFDFTDDKRFRDSAFKALQYVSAFSDARPEAAGMHNARNTDYLVPYGIARFFQGQDRERQLANRVFVRLFQWADRADHPFAAVDDRYWCHYIGHSVLRALRLPSMEPALHSIDSSTVYFPGSGHLIRPANASNCGAIISLRKGGAVTLFDGNGGWASDYGWMIDDSDTEFVTHWWSDQWTVDRAENEMSIEGHVFGHKEQVSKPWKHFILRACSYVFGYRIIQLLKKAVIFKKGATAIRFHRRICLNPNGVDIHDTFNGLTGQESVRQAPRMSKRHVASADSFQREDLALLRSFERKETREENGAKLTIRVSYAMPSKGGHA